MTRFTRFMATVTIAMLIAGSPIQGISGEISFKLPYSFLGMATCKAPAIEEVSASCNWKKNKKSGYDIHCDVNKSDDSVRELINVRMNTWKVGKKSTSPKRNLIKNLFYKYRGISCTIYFPSTTSGLDCTRNNNGFHCSWCGRKNCYQGEATIR